MARILLIDDDVEFSPLLAEALERHGHRVRWLDGAEPGLALLTPPSCATFDVVLLDNCLPRMHGLEFLEELRHRDVHLPVLLFTGRWAADVAIRASKLGAFRFLPKPDGLGGELGRLLSLLAEAAEVSRLGREPVRLPGDAGGTGEDTLLGDSEGMCAVYEAIGLAARHDGPVLITGETGTGKDLAARALFHHSARAGRPLLKINCAAFAEDRLEDELFGCEAGAYPGLDRAVPGLFEQANGGAVLLDHFPVLGRSAQARLVRLIEEGVVQRNGRGSLPLAVRVRVLACANQVDPAAGRVDPELYYRLAATSIHLPPLRDRGEDVKQLADHFLRHASADLARPVRSIHRQARDRLRRHPWPGNVRELQGVIRQAALSCRGVEVGPADLKIDPCVPGVEPPGGGSLPPSRERAYRLFLWAVEENPDLADGTDADVFRWLRQELRVEGEGLPARCQTFERYLREARAHYHDHKHTPRAGRAAGRSVVRIDQV